MISTTKKRSRKKHIIAACILVVLAVVVAFSVIYANRDRKIEIDEDEEIDYHYIEYQGDTYEFNSSVVPILVLGIDTTDPSNTQGQSDTIQMILLNRASKSIQVISIPRDTMTEIRLFDVGGTDLGWQRRHLNLAYAYGKTPLNGCMYASQAISRLFNEIPMARFAAMNLTMLEKMHSLVGTLEVVIPNDSLAEVNPEWTQGSVATLTNDNVEQFLRYRNTSIDFSNVTRMERQEAYLSAYFASLKASLENDFDGMVANMYGIIQETTTNISLNDMIDFAQMILNYKFDTNSDVYTLKGQDITGVVHDEFEVDKEALTSLIIDLFYTKKGE